MSSLLLFSTFKHLLCNVFLLFWRTRDHLTTAHNHSRCFIGTGTDLSPSMFFSRMGKHYLCSDPPAKNVCPSSSSPLPLDWKSKRVATPLGNNKFKINYLAAETRKEKLPSWWLLRSTWFLHTHTCVHVYILENYHSIKWENTDTQLNI